MNSIWYRQKAQSHQQEIAKLQQQKAKEVARVHDFQKRSNDAASKAARASSPSSASSYFRDSQRYSDQAIGAQQKVASIEQKLAQEHQRLTEARRTRQTRRSANLIAADGKRKDVLVRKNAKPTHDDVRNKDVSASTSIKYRASITL